MRKKSFWIATSCVLAVVGLRPVFSSSASPASNYKVIYSFQGGADGANPMSDLTLDATGNLYGTTAGGGVGTGCGNEPCGTVFELERTRNGWEKKVLYNFTGGGDGGLPYAGVTFDSAGNMYGTAVVGGSGSGYGTVFKLTLNSRGRWTEKTIYTFSLYGRAGYWPNTDLVFDKQGDLYGTTMIGGENTCSNGNGCGASFELTPQADGSWMETTLHTFIGPPDGGNPGSPVILDAHGNIYGATEFGGTGACVPYNSSFTSLGCGTVYKLTRSKSGGKWAESIVYDFVRGGGRAVYPSGGLLFDKAGNLFGTSRQGGNGWGAIFELHARQDGSWWQSDPHLFYGKPDGREAPFAVEGILARLFADAEGNLYTVNSWGGGDGDGVVFELQPAKDSWEPKILYTFPSLDGNFNPVSGLVLDSRRHLYGTTKYGGNVTGCGGTGCGTVYEITP